jgi:hypothetical protein
LHDATVPSEPGPPLYLDFTIALIQGHHSVRLLWMGDKSTQRHLRYNTTLKRNILTFPSRIRTNNFKMTADADAYHSRHDRWDRHNKILLNLITCKVHHADFRMHI